MLVGAATDGVRRAPARLISGAVENATPLGYGVFCDSSEGMQLVVYSTCRLRCRPVGTFTVGSV